MLSWVTSKAVASARLNNVIHRDISLGNIILYPEHRQVSDIGPAPLYLARRGVLIDWELSMNIPRAEDVGQYHRTVGHSF
jgi:thiamine kinase-like enzyme